MKSSHYIEAIRSFIAGNGEKKIPIYIYGAGKYAGILYSLLLENNIKIAGFIVSDPEANPSEVMGMPVHGVMELADHTGLILIGFLQHGEKKIQDTLKNQGFTDVIELPEDIFQRDSWYSLRYRSPVLEVTPKIGCAVNCHYCPQTLLTGRYFKDDKKRKSMMSFEEYKQLLLKTPDNLMIDWSGFVEPFFNPQAIDMMEYTEHLGRHQALFTTLQGLSDSDFERVLKIDFDEVVLHTADDHGYANIPVTDKYLSRIDTILEAKKSDGTPFLTNANCQFTPDQRVIEHTAGRLKIYCEMSDRAGNLENSDKVLSSKNSSGNIYCSRSPMINHNVLLPDGTVVLCCNDFGLEYVLGNLFEQSYEELIHSKTTIEVKRRMHIETEKPLICRNCMYAEKVEASDWQQRK